MPVCLKVINIAKGILTHIKGGIFMAINSQVREHTFAGVSQLSLRSLIIGTIGSCIITASSMYVALRISALPWPTIFVAVLSMALLKAMGKTTLNEINVTQTAMSAGAMVAGGLAFTLPGLWITGDWSGSDLLKQHFWKVLAISMAGMLLGTLLTWYLRQKFIVRDALPYPIGMAAAETITAGDKVGRKSFILFSSMGISAIFTYFRDVLGPKIKWNGLLESNWLYSKNLQINMWISPMAAGIGYMIGPLYTGVWFLGAIISYLLIIPLGPTLGIFESVEAATGFKNSAGMGLMVGTGVGVLISLIISTVKKAARKNTNADKAQEDKSTGNVGRIIAILTTLAAYVFSVAAGLGPVVSVLMTAGVFLASAIAATVQGQTGVNPMEVFGIIVLLIIRIFVDVSSIEAFFIAACVAVACGYAGDLLNDYKTGHVIGTNPKAQLISQIVGGITGTVVASVAMFAIIDQFGGVGPGTSLPAAQASMVSSMVEGVGEPVVFVAAIVAGAALYLLKVPSMTLGIGLYLPFYMSSIVFLGGLIRLFVDKFRPSFLEDGNVAASGLLGGEGVTGVVVAVVRMITGG